MTLEEERGCGYRKEDGLYLVSEGPSVSCDRLPVPISPCECCGFVPQQVRAYNFVSGKWLGEHRRSYPNMGLVGGELQRLEGTGHLERCEDSLRASYDPICVPSAEDRVVMWVGRRFYTPASFAEEAHRLGVSKRIPQVPDGLVLGKTWVLLAHPDACHEPVSWAFHWLLGDGEVGTSPGLFQAFVPSRVEIVLTESKATEERIEKEAKRGVSVVIIPDGAQDARVSWRPGEPRPEEAPPRPGAPAPEVQADVDEAMQSAEPEEQPEPPEDNDYAPPMEGVDYPHGDEPPEW